MPLYEMIVLTRCSSPAQLSSMFRQVVNSAWRQGGNVRQVSIMADRILSKEMKNVQGHKTMVGRYSQILIDASPYALNEITKEIQLQKSILKIASFKIKDFYAFTQTYGHKAAQPQIIDRSRRLEQVAQMVVNAAQSLQK